MSRHYCITKAVDAMEEAMDFSYWHDQNHPDDAAHRVFRDTGLREEAELHRFDNPNFNNGGIVKCSAIYKDGSEYGWHYRDREEDLIDWWQDRGYLMVEMRNRQCAV